MAEAKGLKSGLSALATFACRSTVALYESIRRFSLYPKQVRDLLEELAALNAEVSSLAELIQAKTDVDLSGLSLPLLQCGNACREFQQETLRCLSQSSDSRSKVRSWTRLRYMGDNIDGFRRLLADYRMTFGIALTDANLRQFPVTAENLQSFKDLVETVKDDLEDRLKSIYEKLEQVFGHAVDNLDSDATELRLMKKERLNVEICLQICAHLSDHLNQIQVTHEPSSPESVESDVMPEIITSKGLQECKNSLLLTKEKLERRLKILMDALVDALVTNSKAGRAPEEDIASTINMLEEWETILKCLDICSQADKHAKEAISSFDKHSTGDAIQFLISTNGSMIHGRNRGLGWRTRQVGGLISDAMLQQLSLDMCTVDF
ncbi:hypothetical protein BDV06DRAFT_161609 [Aspergillus oleicola]